MDIPVLFCSHSRVEPTGWPWTPEKLHLPGHERQDQIGTTAGKGKEGGNGVGAGKHGVPWFGQLADLGSGEGARFDPDRYSNGGLWGTLV